MPGKRMQKTLSRLRKLQKLFLEYRHELFPPPEPTVTPVYEREHMANLGCLNGTYINDLVSVNVLWDKVRKLNLVESGQTGNLADTTTVPVNSTVGSDSTITNQLNNGSSSTFQASVYLRSLTEIYDTPFNAFGYTSISLSQEGLLWTLWPLTRHSDNSHTDSNLYSSNAVFGTSLHSRYPVGQLGFFINNRMQGCTPLGAVQPDNELVTSGSVVKEGPSPFFGLVPGIEGLNAALITATNQLIGLVVVKVTEQVARTFNPASGASSSQRFLYLGYDGWAVIRTTATPISPMASQVYLSPQYNNTINGTNYQVIFPPNFVQAIYYKNSQRTVPASTNVGLNAFSVYATASTVGLY